MTHPPLLTDFDPGTDTHRSASAVEHALADHKRWKQLTRWTNRREALPDTYRALAGLISDRTAKA
ncbi:hypothetical protein [Streptomyces sp. NPDC047725]|uniref:hypothetical protein n=1 Tax=Streptomyces sp. NPDC047725 TaxID=3365487 RepID=UPI00372132F2